MHHLILVATLSAAIAAEPQKPSNGPSRVVETPQKITIDTDVLQAVIRKEGSVVPNTVHFNRLL